MSRRPADSPDPAPDETPAAPPPSTGAERGAARSASPAQTPPATPAARRKEPESDSSESDVPPSPVESAPAPAPQAHTTSSPPSGPPSLRDRRVGIIGAGAMGSALCRGLIHAEAVPANRILVSDLHTAHVQALRDSLGVRMAESNVQVARYTDIILLAVKPLTVPVVLDEIAESLRRDSGKPAPLLICIAAGVRTATIESHLKDPIPVVRAMPNTPAQVGRGACAYCAGSHADETHRALTAAIFQAVGNAVEVPETMMDAVTALSGSGPAYVYLMIEALVDGGVKVGLPREVAYQLAAQTVLGAAQMVIETGLHPAQLRDMVTTPAGSTIAAIAALEHSGVRAALIDAVECAANRARELA